MSDEVTKAAELKALLPLLSPGLVILGIRQAFLSTPAPSFQERALTYAGVSAVYFAALQPIAGPLSVWIKSPEWFGQWVEYLLLPCIVGLAYGAATHYDLIFKIAAKFKLSPVHNAPSAWDYAFRRMPKSTYLCVTLVDGSKVYGAYGAGSFSSSVKEERDILLSHLFEYTEENGLEASRAK